MEKFGLKVASAAFAVVSLLPGCSVFDHHRDVVPPQDPDEGYHDEGYSEKSDAEWERMINDKNAQAPKVETGEDPAQNDTPTIER